MEARKRWIVGLVSVICVVLSSALLLATIGSQGLQRHIYGTSTLSGLEEVNPQVSLIQLGEPTTSKVESLTENDLQTHVELALRRAGMKVAKDRSNTNTATLGITVLVMKITGAEEPPSDAESYVSTVLTGIYQDVELIRDHKIRTLAETWPLGPSASGGRGFALLGADEVEQQIKNNVTKQVDEFINDYLAANPQGLAEGRKSKDDSRPSAAESTRGLVAGVLYSDDPATIIGTRILKVGDTIHGVTVVRILKGRVEFEKNGRRWTQRVGQTPSPEWQPPPAPTQ
jgi:hypothetical protein